MDPLVLGSIIQSGASVANTSGNIVSAGIFGRRNERWARQDATTAYNRQRQLLADERAYSSPAAEMQRYIDAGLNPNLIYGQSQGFIGAPSVPQASSASTAPPQMSLDGSAFLNAQLMKAQIKNLNADADQKDKLTPEMVKNMISDTKLKDANVDNIIASTNQINQTVENLKSQKQILDTQVGLSQTELANRIIDLTKRQTYLDEEFDAYAAQLGISVQEYKYLVATFTARVNNVELNNKALAAQLRLTNAQASSLEKQLPFLTNLYEAQTRDAILSAGIHAVDLDVKSTYSDADKWFGYAESVLNGASRLTGSIMRGASGTHRR